MHFIDGRILIRFRVNQSLLTAPQAKIIKFEKFIFDHMLLVVIYLEEIRKIYIIWRLDSLEKTQVITPHYV